MTARGRRAPAIKLEARTGQPVFRQIMLQVQRHLSGGRLRSGDRLPTVRELAVQLGVNFNTVARAYRMLQAEGLVSAQQGRGTFISSGHTQGQIRRLTLQSLAARYIAEARLLDLSDAQIAAAITTRLAGTAAASHPGENYE